MAKKKRGIDEMLDEIRRVIGNYDNLNEREVYEALLDEAEGWEMRLAELEREAESEIEDDDEEEDDDE